MSENQKLSPAKFGLLGFQHMFAMFGATVLVPALTGLSVSATLLFAGLGTLLFHLLTKGKVPAFLGSSFAFLGGYFAIAGMEQFADGAINWIPYAGVGVACAGLIYCVVAALFKVFGAEKVMRFFPPIVTGPIIIAIGLILSNSAVNNCATNWPIAILALVIVVAFNIWGKGMLKIIPILLGVVVSYIGCGWLLRGGCDLRSGGLLCCEDCCLDRRALPVEGHHLLPDRQLRLVPADHLHPDHGPHLPGHHDGAHRRYVRHLLHRWQELYQGSRPAPLPAG